LICGLWPSGVLGVALVMFSPGRLRDGVLAATRTCDLRLAPKRISGVGRGFVNLGASYREPWQRLQCLGQPAMKKLEARTPPSVMHAISVRGGSNSTESELDARAAGAAVLMPRPGVRVAKRCRCKAQGARREWDGRRVLVIFIRLYRELYPRRLWTKGPRRRTQKTDQTDLEKRGPEDAGLIGP
jgi:hypothetical protein